jgi:ABC-type transport system involved in multi-copper enzyme maturation permease subunit
MIRLFKYEFLRITSLRSSWVLTILGTLMTAGISYLALSSMTSNGLVSTSEALSLSNLTPAFVPLWGVWAATISSQAFGHDYRHGTIRITLSTFPNRLAVYFVRVFTILIWCAVWLAVTFAIVIAEVNIFVAGGVNWETSSGAIGRVVIFNLLFVLSAVVIVMITRVLALGTVVPLMMASVIEGLVARFIPEKLQWTAEYYPYSRALNWTMPWNIDGPENAYPLAVLTVILLVVAGVMFSKRDA